MAGGTLHREDWARAALEAMAAGGVSAVKVETLAPTLGATKGSFYWHFADRADLIEAAVALWEESETEAIIESLADADDPRDRLRRLFSIIFVHPDLGAVDAALIAARDQPAIASRYGASPTAASASSATRSPASASRPRTPSAGRCMPTGSTSGWSSSGERTPTRCRRPTPRRRSPTTCWMC